MSEESAPHIDYLIYCNALKNATLQLTSTFHTSHNNFMREISAQDSVNLLYA